MIEGKTVLIKVGGSLLSLRDLGERLQQLFTATRASKIVVVPGGGEVTDFVRQWDRTHSLETEVSHRLAVDSLGLTARLLASLLPDAGLASSQAKANRSQKVSILDVPAILAEAENQKSPPLPSGWHVTSDSIAAWIAVQWGVDELILAKSVDAPAAIPGNSNCLQPVTAERAVDAGFGHFIPDLPPLFWCNLRGDPTELFALEKSQDGVTLVRDSLQRRK